MNLRAAQADQKLGARTAEWRLQGRRLPVTNVVGWGSKTFVQATISGSGSSQQVSDWGPADPDALDGGDGTVPYRSASWLRGADVVTYHLPVGYHSGATQRKHSSLWRNPGGRNLLEHLLGGEGLTPFVYAAVDETDFARPSQAQVRVRISALDDSALPLDGVHVSATDLVGGHSFEQDLAAGDGRHVIRVPRAKIRLVHHDLFRRFTLRFSWDGGSVDRVLVVRNQNP
jgi:hypothetical protein